MVLNIKPSFWSILLSVTILLFLMVNFVWPDGEYRERTIDGDGRGYYDYLPTLLINKTVDFKQAYEYEKAIQPLEYMGPNFHKIKDVYINKFPVGTALMILPFYLVAQITSLIAGLPADGYSIFYQYAVALAALWWLWVGIYYLRKLLKSYAISETTILLVALGLILGTNLLHHAFVDVAFSHVYSFAAITAFLYVSRRMLLTKGKRYVLVSAFLLGLIVLIRNVNGLAVLAVPLLADNRQVFKKRMDQLLGSVTTCLLIAMMFLLGILPQLIINYLQTDNPVFYGYRGEGFTFLHPHFVDFLFSFKKGWFVYTPFMLLLFPASASLWRKSKFHFWSFFFFLSVVVYVFSSWWNWYYGDGFGMRPMVDYYGLFALVIAWWMEKLKPMARTLVLVVIVLFSALNVIQTYQYSKGIIDVDSMTKEAYEYVFLRTSDRYRNVVGSGDESFYGKLTSRPLLKSINSFEVKPVGWSSPASIDTNIFKSLSRRFAFNKNVPYSSSFNFVFDTLISKNKLYLKLSLYYLEPTADAACEALYVVDIRDSLNKLRFYKAFRLKRLPDKEIRQWRRSYIGMVLPHLEQGDKVKVYCWNKALTRFNIDDFSVALYGIYPGF